MNTFTVPKSQFDWPKFALAIAGFSLSRGADDAFPIVEDGKLILDLDELTLADGEEIDDVPSEPIDRLDAGFDVFAMFAMTNGIGGLECADDTVIEVPNLDDEECGECHSYGFQIGLKGRNLVFRPVLMSEVNGECSVETVAHAALVEKPINQFVKSFVRKTTRRRKT